MVERTSAVVLVLERPPVHVLEPGSTLERARSRGGCRLASEKVAELKSVGENAGEED
jgi:hypothetical protein